MSELHVWKIDGAERRSLTKMITETKELYWFLATLGVEVMKLAFASNDLVWILWKYGADKSPYSASYERGNWGLRHRGGTNPSLSLSRPAAREHNVLWQWRCIIRSAEGGRTPPDRNGGLIGGNNLRVAHLVNHFRICEGWVKELRVQSVDRGGSRKDFVQSEGRILELQRVEICIFWCDKGHDYERKTGGLYLHCKCINR